MPLIELRGVTKTYRNGDLAVEVLHGIDLAIYPGEFVAIMGASGSGKTTLMNILGCLDRPTAGSYRFMGEDVSALDRDELARAAPRSVRLRVPELQPDRDRRPRPRTSRCPRSMPACRRPSGTRAPSELLGMLGLADRRDHRPNQLSGGQQQRVSIARALMNGGRIILADEPTGALDSKSGAEVMRCWTSCRRKGHTVILITHAREVAEHAPRVIEIKDGRIVADPGPQPPANHNAADAWQPRRGRISHGADVAEAAKTALRALRANVFRSVLTLLGIVIGVASVIAMLAIGDGAKQAVHRSHQRAWARTCCWCAPVRRTSAAFGNTATLVLADVQAIDREVPNVLAAVPEQAAPSPLRFGGADYSDAGDRHLGQVSAGAQLAGRARHLLQRRRRARLRDRRRARPDRRRKRCSRTARIRSASTSCWSTTCCSR